MKTAKLKDLFNDYMTKNSLKPGYDTVTPGSVQAINVGAMDFIQENTDGLSIDITGDANADADILDVFCQTFIKHFWNSRIGYSDPMDFYVNLSGFLAENLPLWAQFYKEAIVKRGSFITGAGQVTVMDDGQVKVTGTTGSQATTATTNNGSSNTTASTKGASDSTNTNNTTTTGTTEESNDTTATQNDSKQNLTLEADTPQDRLAYDPAKIKGGDFTSAYAFEYASKVTGDFSNDQTTNSQNGKTSSTSETTANGTSETKGTTDSDTTTTGTTDKKSTGSTTVNGNTNSSTQNQATHDTTRQERAGSVASLALEMNHLANGAYSSIFKKAKLFGLFLLIY